MRETSGNGAPRAGGVHRARGPALTAGERRATVTPPRPDAADADVPGSGGAHPLAPGPVPAVRAGPAVPTGSAAAAGRQGPARRLIPAGRERLFLWVGSIVAVLALGAIAVLVIGSNNAGADTAANRSHALAKLRTADGHLQSAIKTFRAGTSACGQDLSCITGLDARVAHSFASFGASVTRAGVPAHFAAAVTRLTADTKAASADFRRLAAARSTTTYLSVEAAMGLQATLSRWETALGGLEGQLTAGH
jgi:hypothetical protein